MPSCPADTNVTGTEEGHMEEVPSYHYGTGFIIEKKMWIGFDMQRLITVPHDDHDPEILTCSMKYSGVQITPKDDSTMILIVLALSLLIPAWSSRCPANQRYLPAVQFGCPASCDQPIPLCYAAIGPGCGCRPGRVLAGSSRPRNPDQCISPRRCSKPAATTALCPHGSPLKDSASGVELFCGRGGEPCPQGSTCNIDPADRFAVCCPDPVVFPPKDSCIVSGCNGEICADEVLFSICLAPTCEQSCLKFATCQTSEYGVCAWNTSAKQYDECLGNCNK